jgi:hypothetical protein
MSYLKFFLRLIMSIIFSYSHFSHLLWREIRDVRERESERERERERERQREILLLWS